MIAESVYENARRAIAAGVFVEACVELAQLVIDDSGAIRRDADRFVAEVRDLLVATGVLDGAARSAAKGLSQYEWILRVTGKLEYEEVMLVVSSSSAAFAILKLAELLNHELPVSLQQDKVLLREAFGGNQRRSFGVAISEARRRAFVPLPADIVT